MTRAQVRGWTSLIARAAIGSMYASTSIRYLVNGTGGVIHYVESHMAKTWLPTPLVSGFAHAVPWLELLIWTWLLVGWQLEVAWVVASLYTVALGFGNMLALEHANDYLHVLVCLVGLGAARWDRVSVDAWLARRHVPGVHSPP